MSEPLIRIKDLKVIYNQGKENEVRSLDGVSVEIFPQEYVIIFGPSGCGKSTLLYAISGLQASTSGEAEVAGMQLSKMKKKEMVDLHRTKIGMVFQAFYLIPSLNILDNVCLPKVFSGEKRLLRIEKGRELLKRFGILEQERKFPEQLSGGQKQRVSIARSLVNDPGLILADEPVGNLDSESAENVLSIFKELNEIDKKTIILVTHNPEHLHFADRVIFMRDGKIYKEEVRKEKRPVEALAGSGGEAGSQENISPELRMLMRTFSGLSPMQVGALLAPYKADQLVNHIISELTEEQIKRASESVREVLVKNVKFDQLSKKLDMAINQGGAGWNKTRAESFSERIRDIMTQAENLKKSDFSEISQNLGDYLEKNFQLSLNEEQKKRFRGFLAERIGDKIDGGQLRDKMDKSLSSGGLGLRKEMADKISREVEIIKFVHYEA
ncbi:MAG: ABC transporter ATP-binding protein [Patescibacteria group bacterium]